MSRLQPYSHTGPIDHTLPIDATKLRDKSVLVTGGANGMGEVIVRRFAAAGAFVTFADVNEERGRQVEGEVNEAAGGARVKFVRCDVRSWDDQVKVFEEAVVAGGGRGLDVVIANAGISRSSVDSLWKLDDPAGPPTKPDLNIADTNIHGTLYTFKLAVHYFRKTPLSEGRDRCFAITGSMVAYIDSPANWEYTCSKYALLGLMRTVRRSSWQQGIRINHVAPCYIKSAIRTAEYEKALLDQGVRFGEVEDVASCMMRLATDETINGRSLMIVPRAVASEGFVDANIDDFTDDKHEYLINMQEVQLRVIKDQWLDGEEIQTYKK